MYINDMKNSMQTIVHGSLLVARLLVLYLLLFIIECFYRMFCHGVLFCPYGKSSGALCVGERILDREGHELRFPTFRKQHSH